MKSFHSLACRAWLTVLVALVITAAPVSRATADTALLSFSGGGPATSASDQLYGWIFDVLASVDVTALGVGDTGGDGLSVSHDVGIFRVSDQSLVASATVGAGLSGVLDAEFRYVDLGSSVLLAPDRYVIVMTMPGGTNDSQSVFNTSATTAPEIAYVASAFDGSTTLAFPGTSLNGFFDMGMFGPNFQFEGAAVPEPGTLAMLMGLGMGGLVVIRRRK